MKKVILVIVFGSIASFFTLKCSDGENSSKNNQGDSLLVESNLILDTIANIDSSTTDTSDNMSKVQHLIKSTENSDKKVKEIKVMKKENNSLKKELIKTKEELNQVKKVLDSTIQENESKKKKGFFKTVIDNIKGEKDTVK